MLEKQTRLIFFSIKNTVNTVNCVLTPIDPLKLSTFIPNFAYVAQNADGQLKIKHGKIFTFKSVIYSKNIS